ncbi:spore coat protein GerQ [Bacillus dakarensis]|uniref:spore coat protein GerQ n=1 Tax=Robertmurraya dakarensis TaxID=1926278 RepID=UPI000982211A|nr:spore coat protein GerQ [Bacillus dakarensis]
MTYNQQYPYWQQQQQYHGAKPAQMPAYGAQPSMGQPTIPTQSGGMFPGMPGVPGVPNGGATPPPPQVPGMLPLEQSYIENILRLNKGKLARVVAIFDGANGDGNTRTFTGIIEAAGRDHLIMSEPETGNRILLPMVYFGYATFEEELEYDYPYGMPGATTYPPR